MSFSFPLSVFIHYIKKIFIFISIGKSTPDSIPATHDKTHLTSYQRESFFFLQPFILKNVDFKDRFIHKF